jgi:hypothetical protein
VPKSEMKSKNGLKPRLLSLRGLDFDSFAKMIGLSGRQKWMIRTYINLNTKGVKNYGIKKS